MKTKESTTEDTTKEADLKATEEKKGSTEALFTKDEITRFQGDSLPVGIPKVDSPPIEKKKEDPTKEPPVDDKTTSVEYLKDLSQRVKTKINGEEGEATIEELQRGFQTARSLTLKGQELARKEKDILAREAALTKAPATNPIDTDSTLRDESLYEPSVDEALKRELKEVRETLSGYAPLLGQVKYKTDLDDLDLRMRSEGLDDFNEYVSKIEQEILDAPQLEREGMLTHDHFEKRYKSMKLADLRSNKDIKLNPDERPQPKVPIEDGSSVGGAETDVQVEAGRKLKAKAMETHKNSDWTAYLTHLNQGGTLIQRSTRG